jgi:hypothetical protein
VQDPEGMTTQTFEDSQAFGSLSSVRMVCFAIFRASERIPALKAGWLQQVCPGGITTSAPARANTSAVDRTTRGKKLLARQVVKSWTQACMSDDLGAFTSEVHP